MIQGMNDKPHISLIEKGFAVLKYEDRFNLRAVCIFDSWIDAHNYLYTMVGENNGEVYPIKEIQGKVEVENNK